MTEHRHHVALTQKTFDTEVIGSPDPVLVDFWADWCGPCHRIAPVIEELAAEFDGRVRVGKVNVDENPELSRRYGIRSIPSLLFFNNGQVVDHLIGAVPKKAIVEKLNALVQAV